MHRMNAAICWDPLRAGRTRSPNASSDNRSGLGDQQVTEREPQRLYAAHLTGSAEGGEIVQTASRRSGGWGNPVQQVNPWVQGSSPCGGTVDDRARAEGCDMHAASHVSSPIVPRSRGR